MSIKHAFHSAKDDGADATLVRRSNWNAEHVTDLSKVAWKSWPANVLTDKDRTTALDWTDLDLTSATSVNTKFALLFLRFHPSVAGTAGDSILSIRKNGTNPACYNQLRVSYYEGAWALRQLFVIQGLDSGQIMEYKIDPATGATVTAYIDVLGYI